MVTLNTITKKDLAKAIENHEKWLKHKSGGKRLVLTNYDLTNSDFSKANLTRARFSKSKFDRAHFNECNLTHAEFDNASLQFATFCDVDLTDSDFSDAICNCADFDYVNLTNACFQNVNLARASFINCKTHDMTIIGANLTNADISQCEFNDVIADEDTVGYHLVCPEKGEFTAFKQARLYDDTIVIVELKVSASALRSSATTRKCRVSKAKVRSITSLDGKKTYTNNAYSMYTESFTYKLGQTVEVKNFDKNRWNECAPGIHCFITRNEAVNY